MLEEQIRPWFNERRFTITRSLEHSWYVHKRHMGKESELVCEIRDYGEYIAIAFKTPVTLHIDKENFERIDIPKLFRAIMDVLCI